MMNGGRFDRVLSGAVVTAALGLLGASLVQCSATEGGSQVGGGAANGAGGGAASGAGANGGNTGIDVQGGQDYNADAFFVNDPPPPSCNDAGAQPKVPGGTPDCPDDKNLEGCPCTQAGETAACWPGYRRNRNHGACQDGHTTCRAAGENALAWGPCEGYGGIDPNTGEPLGSSGKAACTCFSSGYWKLANMSPCFYTSSGNQVSFAVSTVDTGGGVYQCPQGLTAGSPAPATFTPDTVTADCTGYFRLCYTFKALATLNGSPQPTDCTMKQICTEAYYGAANQEQAFPPLPGWITSGAETSCAQQFVNNGGYAEMSVDGTSDECDKVGKVFQTVTYCPFKCAQNPSDPDCASCTNGGGGAF